MTREQILKALREVDPTYDVIPSAWRPTVGPGVTVGDIIAQLDPTPGKVTIWAETVPGMLMVGPDGPRSTPTGAVLVKLPPNCSIDGNIGELRGMVANLASSLVRIDREYPAALTEAQKQMLAEIIGWMAAL